MNKMSSLTFPDGSSYEIVDETARKEASETKEALKKTITDAFDDTKNYTVGDYCIHENSLYIFTANKSAGEWDESEVTATNVSSELDKLNTKLSTSSGTITWGSGVSSSARSANCKKYGNVVVLNFTFNALSAIASGTPFITLPSGYRPSDNVYFVVKQAGSQTNEVNAIINTNGQVSSANLALTANAYYVGQATFIV